MNAGRLKDFVTTITDKRLPPFHGAGITREGGSIPFGKGVGRFFISQNLFVRKINGKFTITSECH